MFVIKDIIYLGASPSEEPCVQLGTPGYLHVAFDECTRYIRLIRNTLGIEPEGARLFIKRNAHDFGTYLEVCCEYEVQNEPAERYAWACEDKAPKTWKG